MAGFKSSRLLFPPDPTGLTAAEVPQQKGGLHDKWAPFTGGECVREHPARAGTIKAFKARLSGSVRLVCLWSTNEYFPTLRV